MVVELSTAALLEVDRGSSQLRPERCTDSIALLKPMVLTSKSECCWLLICINPTDAWYCLGSGRSKVYCGHGSRTAMSAVWRDTENKHF